VDDRESKLDILPGLNAGEDVKAVEPPKQIKRLLAYLHISSSPQFAASSTPSISHKEGMSQNHTQE
jgi:hypothetical protein